MENTNINLRSYEHLYMDSNQSKPEDTPVLGFISDIEEITMKTGDMTYFHFPMLSSTESEMDSIYLSATTLVDNGSIVGDIPFRSDRIYVKNAGYGDKYIWDSNPPKNLQNGQWICAWLSGDVTDENSKPVWMDRWYFPTNTTSGDALYEADGKYVIDRPSQLIFRPGQYYRYYHMGDERNQEVVDMLSTGDSLKLHFDSWVVSGMVDESGHGIVGELVNLPDASFTEVGVNLSECPEDYGVKFVGDSQSILVPYETSVYVPRTGDFSVVSWVKSSNWETETSEGIIDQGFRGGWKIGIVNGAKVPFTVFVDSTLNDSYNVNNGNIAIINEYGNLIASKSLTGDISNISDVVIDADMFTWILDNPKSGEHNVYQLDYNGNKNATVSIPSTSALKYIEATPITDNQRIAAFNDTEVYLIDRYSLLVDDTATITDNGYYSTITTTNDSFDYITDSTLGFIDNAGVIMQKSELPDMENSTDIVSIRCDYDDNVWVLHSDGTLDKFVYKFTEYVLDNTYSVYGESEPTSMDFVSIHNNGEAYDVIYISYKDIYSVYIYDKTGSYIETINLSKYYVRPSLMCVSPYDWWRRFGTKRSIYARVCVGENTNNDFTKHQDRHILTCSLDDISNTEWHQVALVRSGTQLKLFVDCVERDSATIGANQAILYPYRPSLVIGGTCGRARDLGSECGIKNSYFSGAVDDLRIYALGLNKYELYYIYMNKFKRSNMTWNVQSHEKYYLEKIQKFFKFKMPGSKSAHYNIRISGIGLTEDAKSIVESLILNTINKLTPAYTDNMKIIWDN